MNNAGKNKMKKILVGIFAICIAATIAVGETGTNFVNDCGVQDGPTLTVTPDGWEGYGMYETVIVDSENNYIIVYSRGDERPSNANAECGVTWQELGPESRQGFIMRWMSVYPDHYMEEYVPNDENIPWATGAWSQDTYDQSLVGTNKPSVMGPYHPMIYCLSQEEFEELGCPIDIDDMPPWESSQPRGTFRIRDFFISKLLRSASPYILGPILGTAATWMCKEC